ncbi:MAG: hypothetical protein P9X24_00525 [Candidatus Hatepunaea meridiana]|nr:hypothetical protein [Candidatus Hatepunaea meridiana]
MPQKKKVEGTLPVPKIIMDDESAKTPREDSGLRLSTIIRQEKVDSNVAAAVMKAHGLTPRDRIARRRFKSMIDSWLKAPVGGK